MVSLAQAGHMMLALWNRHVVQNAKVLNCSGCNCGIDLSMRRWTSRRAPLEDERPMHARSVKRFRGLVRWEFHGASSTNTNAIVGSRNSRTPTVANGSAPRVRKDAANCTMVDHWSSASGRSEVAAFVDFENIRYSRINSFGREPDPLAWRDKALKYGLMAVARAYADFDQHPAAGAHAARRGGVRSPALPGQAHFGRERPGEDPVPRRSQFRHRRHQHGADAARHRDLPPLHRGQGFHPARDHAAQPAGQEGRHLRRAGVGQPGSGGRRGRGGYAAVRPVGRRRLAGHPGDRRLRPAAPRRLRADAKPHEPHPLAVRRPQPSSPRSTSRRR